MEECQLHFTFGQHLNKRRFTHSREGDKQLLRDLALEGMEYRYGTGNETARQRIDKELHIIDLQDFNAYF